MTSTTNTLKLTGDEIRILDAIRTGEIRSAADLAQRTGQAHGLELLKRVAALRDRRVIDFRDGAFCECR